MDSAWIESLPDWYLAWCWDEQPLQDWWRESWEVPFPGSNINVGDRFTLGRSRQACVIVYKTYNIGKHTVGRDWCSYEIGGDRGGHWYRPEHTFFTEHGGYGYLIPTAEQLTRLGYYNTALRLTDSMVVTGLAPQCRCWRYAEAHGEHARECPARTNAEVAPS